MPYGGMTGPQPKKKDKGADSGGDDKGIFGGYDPISVLWDVTKNVVRSGFSSESPKSGSSGGGSGGGGNSRGGKGYPGISPEARAKGAQAQARANHYRDTQRAANKLKRKIKANNGPVGVAGQEQRKLDLARMRKLQAQANRDKAAAQGMGMRMGGSGTSPGSGGSGGGGGGGGGGSSTGGSGGGGASASNAVARATSGGGSASSPSTGKKYGAVIQRARAAREQNLGVAISAKELRAFMNAYESSHKGSLSRENAVLLARQIKKRGGKVAQAYGLAPVEESRAPGTGIH